LRWWECVFANIISILLDPGLPYVTIFKRICGNNLHVLSYLYSKIVYLVATDKSNERSNLLVKLFLVIFE